MKLTREQRRVVETISGPLLIFAPVGTGKTSVMAVRTQRALEAGIDPDRILCVTFTNRAANEMRLRMQQRKVQHLESLMVSTIHSLCAFMLRSHSKSIGIPKNFLIADDRDTTDILRIAVQRVRQRLNVSDKFFAVDQYASEILTYKSNVHLDGLELTPFPPVLTVPNYMGPPENLFRRIDATDKKTTYFLSQVLDEYHRLLRRSMLLDFADLIYYTRALLHHDSDFRSYWEHRFGWIQVDEVQDITQAEFEILLALSRRHQNIALFGDPDQTIYEWRGSMPFDIIEQFKDAFPNYRQLQLTWNFRSTKQLIVAADNVARHFQRRYTQLRPAEHLPEGEYPFIIDFDTATEEALWIGAMINEILEEEPQASIAVLTRTNAYADSIASVLAAQGLQPVTATRLSGFRSPVTKYVTTILRLLMNPHDQFAARTLVNFYRSPEISAKVEPLTAPGVHTASFFYDRLIQSPSLLQQFLNALAEDRVYIIDIETTSVHPHTAEIVEIAVAQIDSQLQIRNWFHRYISPERFPSNQKAIHRLTPDFLQRYGDDKEQVLLELLHFVGLQPFFVGYNVTFDLNILQKELEQHQLSYISFSALDLLPIVQQTMELKQFSLSAVAKHLKFPPYPSHMAMADVKTTIRLLRYLFPTIQRLSTQNPLAPLPSEVQTFCRAAAEKLGEWREISAIYPLQKLLHLIFSTDRFPGFAPIARQYSAFLPAIKTLLDTASEWDQKIRNPFLRLQTFLGFLSLSRSIDDDRSRGDCLVTTVHQSKGMEFDVVFLAGVSFVDFPHIQAVVQKNKTQAIEEEKRLFYVAITRAKRFLFLTWARTDFWRNKGLEGSPFLDFLAHN